jgi:adenosylmethionine-8-amino-7-oxononanoate aminotransferase
MSPHSKAMMTEWNTEELIEAGKRFVWHPFTDMREWCSAGHEPLVLVEDRGALLRDSKGREYIDGNSSIWTNIHGHNLPHINAAIRRQLDQVAHTSFWDSRTRRLSNWRARSWRFSRTRP